MNPWRARWLPERWRSLEKPVGTVWLGWQVKDAGFAQRCHFSGDRHAVRAATVTHALQGVLDRLRQEPSS